MQTINLTIENFLGLNESPDGDSGLQAGEAAAMTNFRVTEEGNLKKMWGYGLFTSGVGAAVIDGLAFWDGLLVFVTDGKIFTYDGAVKTELAFESGVSLTPGRASLFVFTEKLYILNGHEYLYWEGGAATVKTVAGYVPVVLIASAPGSGAGTLYEDINQLSTRRIQRYNGDGTATYVLAERSVDGVSEVIVGGAVLPASRYTVNTNADTGVVSIAFAAAPPSGLDNVSVEYYKSSFTNINLFKGNGYSKTFYLSGKDLDSIDEVKVSGTVTTAYTADLVQGKITFNSAPASNATVSVEWTKTLTPRVRDMRYVQFFGGENNTRVFCYGDGSHTVYYSEPTAGAAKASAEYFPELNRMDIDLDSVAVTALVPYYDRLFIFKEDSVYYAKYASFTGDDGSVVIAFPTTNVTKSVGCTVPEGALSIPQGIVFPAADGIYLASGGTVYEQMSENLISKKVSVSYNSFTKANMLTLNNAKWGECWFMGGSDALVFNYRNGAWYKLDIGKEAGAALYHEGDVYFANAAGEVFRFGEELLSFDGGPINAYWESGSMDFGCFNHKKWLDSVWLTLKSEANSRVTIDLESDRTSDYPSRRLSHGRATFRSADFGNFSFNTNDKPAAKRVRIKAKKFAFLKLIIKNDSATDRVTVMNISAPVTIGGITK